MSQSLLKAEHIKISFGNVHALRDVSLEILPGEIHCLAGENGCGKSTIIKIISGVYQRDGGTIEFNGQKIDKISPIDAINLGIQVIYQDFALFPNLTVAENLALNTELASRKKTVSWKNVRKIAEEAVSKINFQVDLDEKVEKLTVAQKQMVAISRALMSNAKLIIMDEPTVAVDPQSRNSILEGIKRLNKNGATIIYTSHYMEEVEQICSKIAIIDKGQCIAYGTKEELKKMIKTGETITLEGIMLEAENIKEIENIPHVFDVSYNEQTLVVRCTGAKHNLIRILEYMNNKDISFGRVFSELPTLNDVFLEITGKKLRD